nr:hypothetical protein L203_06495 [Cryptococcus depauperatus CBS 7841]
MGIFSVFSKSSPPDYETLLSQLATDIANAKINLSEIRLRERRIALLINLYGISFWIVWIGLWWARALPVGIIGVTHDDRMGRLVGMAGVTAGPFVIYAFNRLVHLFYTRQRSHEENILRDLLTKQRKQLEEIKKMTNYDSTRKLIERYDDLSSPTSSPVSLDPPASPHTPQKLSQSSTPSHKLPIKGPGGTPNAPGHLIEASRIPVVKPGNPISPEQAAVMQSQLETVQPVLPTPEKKWYDRIVDSILGDDPSQANQSNFALVCEKCFRHNGLVGSKYEWERMQWICPRCNHLNPSPISRLISSDSSQSPTPSQLFQTTPSKPHLHPQAPVTPSHIQRSPASGNSIRQRKLLGEKGTPGASKLGQEVFTVEDDESENEQSKEEMDVDE